MFGYKTVTNGLKSGHGNIKWRIGKWQKHEGELNICSSGFHASKHPFDALNYIQGNRFFKVEARGRIIKQKDKFVASEMRLVEEVKNFKKKCVELSVYCAKKCLKNFEKEYPNDKRPREAIVAAENWLKAKNKKEQESAARLAARSAKSAAKSAVESAAWSANLAVESAARSALWSAWSAARLARSAVWSTVRSARLAAESAKSAAKSVARLAAELAMRKQFEKIIKED